jgi:hypothetical protein
LDSDNHNEEYHDQFDEPVTDPSHEHHQEKQSTTPPKSAFSAALDAWGSKFTSSSHDDVKITGYDDEDIDEDIANSNTLSKVDHAHQVAGCAD